MKRSGFSFHFSETTMFLIILATSSVLILLGLKQNQNAMAQQQKLQVFQNNQTSSSHLSSFEMQFLTNRVCLRSGLLRARSRDDYQILFSHIRQVDSDSFTVHLGQWLFDSALHVVAIHYDTFLFNAAFWRRSRK
jgi:hypothetical protein